MAVVDPRKHYSQNPKAFWEWMWADSNNPIPALTKELMTSVARGYPRISARGTHEERIMAVAHTALWWAWCDPESVVYLPAFGMDLDRSRIDLIYEEAKKAHQYFFSAEFVKVPAKDVTGIARAHQDWLCICPLQHSDLKKSKKAHLSRPPTLVLFPDFFACSTVFVGEICAKMGELPNVQIAALSS